jgi:hypothetical protein
MKSLIFIVAFALNWTAIDVAAQPAELAMVQTLCADPSDITKDGCGKCPDYMMVGRDPELNDLTMDQRSSGFRIQRIVEGSFTGKGRHEVFVITEGCFTPAEGLASGILLGENNGQWQRLGFLHDTKKIPLGDCTRVDGRGPDADSLLCEHFEWGQGVVEVLSFTADGQIRIENTLLTEKENDALTAENQEECYSVRAQPGQTLNSHAIELVVTYYQYANPEEGPCGSIDDSKMVKMRAVFYRQGPAYVPDDTSRRLLALLEHIPN